MFTALRTLIVPHLDCSDVTEYVFVCLQENLLQSVLPVYISMKMKLAIMERLQECKDKQEQQRLVKDNNFHSLYVKRHENVRYKHKPLCYAEQIIDLGSF